MLDSHVDKKQILTQEPQLRNGGQKPCFYSQMTRRDQKREAYLDSKNFRFTKSHLSF